MAFLQEHFRRRSSVLATAALAGTLLLAPSARAALSRNPFDAREIAGMREQDPASTERFEAAEALAAQGRLDDALALFERVKAALPSNALPHRRICEVLTALGRGSDAIHDCYTAMEVSRTPASTRAAVRALVGGPAPPTIERLGEALSLLSVDRKHGLRMELSSALCDVADSIGDGIMLQRCVRELMTVAPRAPETRRARARLDERCPPLRFWAGWLAIAAAAMGTAAHALGRRRRRAARVPAAGAALAALVLGLLLAGPSRDARALELPKADQMLSKWPVNDEDPESSIPKEEDRNKDPLNFGYWLQDLIYKAEAASKRGDHAAAVKFYRAMVEAVPDRAVGYRKLCGAYEGARDLDKAIAACGAALLQQGVTTGDYARYVRLVLSKPGDLSAKDRQTLHDVLTTLKADPRAHPLADELQCEVGARTADARELRECAHVLSAEAPEDPGTIRYEWALALARNRFGEARALIDRARKAGAKDEGVRSMERATAAASRRHRWGVVLWILSAGLLTIGAALGARYLLSRRRFPPAAQPT